MEIIRYQKLLPRGKFTSDVVIPKWWLEMHQLTPGSTVRVIASPEKIVIESIKEPEAVE